MSSGSFYFSNLSAFVVFLFLGNNHLKCKPRCIYVCIYLQSMNSMTSAGPMANSVFVVASHKSYPMIPGVTSQVPLSPDNQPQIHLVPANSVGSMSTVNESPARKPLKEGKTLGVSGVFLCKSQATCLEEEVGEGGRDAQTPRLAKLELT